MTALGSPPGMGAIYIGKNTVMDSFNKTSVFTKVRIISTDYADFVVVVFMMDLLSPSKVLILKPLSLSSQHHDFYFGYF
jgi:hypothetical protein